MKPSLWSLILGVLWPVYPARDLDATDVTFALRACGYRASPRWRLSTGNAHRIGVPKTTATRSVMDERTIPHFPAHSERIWLGEKFTREELATISYDELRRRLAA